MITAQEARKLSLTNREKVNDRTIARIEELIYKAIEKGESGVILYDESLPNDIKKVFFDLGYSVVENFYRNCSSTIIRW
jgi:predicted RNA-binding protein (virulence factor B family)